MHACGRAIINSAAQAAIEQESGDSEQRIECVRFGQKIRERHDQLPLQGGSSASHHKASVTEIQLRASATGLGEKGAENMC